MLNSHLNFIPFHFHNPPFSLSPLFSLLSLLHPLSPSFGLSSTSSPPPSLYLSLLPLFLSFRFAVCAIDEFLVNSRPEIWEKLSEMGKYMKKGKITGDLTVMEVPQSALGVRTRARTLALQQSPDLCYLQLRSRRLEKPQFPPPSPPKPERQDKQKLCNRGVHMLQPVHSQSGRAGSRLRVASVNSVPVGSPSFSRSKKLEVGDEEADAEECAAKLGSRSATPLERAKGGAICTDLDDFGVEASFGENNLEFDGTGRVTRESTPCSLIRDLDSIGTPVSAVRPTCSGAAHQRRPRNSVLRSIPSAQEMDDFFANAEMQQQNQFMEKYNFDVVNNLPLPGRYEWVRVDP